MTNTNDLHGYISDFLDSQKPIREREGGLMGRSLTLKRHARSGGFRKKSINYQKLTHHKQEIIDLVSNHFESEEIGLQRLKQNGEVELQRALLKYLSIREIRPCCSRYPGIWPFCRSNC